MREQVWCVFQKLAGERCPTLSAVCASRDVADTMAERGRLEQAAAGDEGCEWSVSAWSVLDGELGEIENIEQISHVLDPMRDGVARPPEPGAAGEPAE